jgi:predicted DCC family thiol-disulfide oxidoreductase YuxK
VAFLVNGQRDMATSSIIIFDGVCNLCNRAVQFVLKYDPYNRYVFTALQSETGATLRKSYHIAPGVDSIVLIEGDHAYTESTAALRIARRLVGLWPLLYGFIIVPKPIRDRVYRWIARNRYRWFGKRDVCLIPSPKHRDRFI